MPVINTSARELLEASRVKAREALAVLGNPNSTAEDITRAEGLKREAESMKARADQMADLLALAELQDVEKAQEPDPVKASKDDDFKHLGGFLGAVKAATLGRKRDPRLKEYFEPGEAKDMSGGSGELGGFQIPIEAYNEMMAVAAPRTIMRAGSTIVRMGSRSLEVPVLDQTDGGSGNPAYFGGVQTYWTEEAAARTASDMKFRQMKLEIHDLAGYTRVSNTLLEDANRALADYLGGDMGFPGAIAWQEDFAFLRGSGVGMPRGILGAPATIKPGSRTTSSTVKYDDLVNMLDLFMGDSPIWIANMKLRAHLMRMAGPTATNYAGMYLWGNAEAGVPAQLLGTPIFFTDKLPAVGSEGDIMLVDRRYYLIGDREVSTVRMEASGDELFKFNQTAFRFIHRVDGRPWLSEAIKLPDDTFVSPFVTLPA
jgi:HK97 family phage major capsid protein